MDLTTRMECPLFQPPPNYQSRCSWSIDGDKSSDPYRHHRQKRSKICSNVLKHIGNTPLVKLNKIPQQYGVKCQVLAKCEFFNPGGSIKDRIALRMIEDAEEKGLIEPGYTLIEPTSGNTGIGLALAAAVKGYRCIIVMPEKMSVEKANVLRALNAEIIRTPTSARYDSPDSHISVAQRLCKTIPKSIILNQYVNSGNPSAHYDETATEILEQCDNKVDMVVVGAGTGGTVTGVGRKLKESLPSCKVVAVDPYGSILAEPPSLNETSTNYYEVEGIGYDFIPTVLDRSVVDEWIKIGDKESLIMARELIAKEGLLCGGSSGSAMAAAMKVAKNLSEDQTCVVILPDSVRNYMTKFIDDNWMAERGFLTESLLKAQEQEKPWFWDLKIDSLSVGAGLITINTNVKISSAISTMKNQGIDQMPVVDSNGYLQGMVTVANTMKCLVGGSASVDDPVETIMTQIYPSINRNDTVGALTTLLKTQSYVVVVDEVSPSDKKVVGIITHVDVLNYLIIDEGVQLLLAMKRNAFSDHQKKCNQSNEKSSQEQCQLCKKTFLTCVALNIHSTKKHNKKKIRTDSTLNCPCGQIFTAKWRQNCVHKLNSHGRHCKAFKKIEIRCEVCKKGFISRKSLEYHGLKAHKLAVPVNSE